MTPEQPSSPTGSRRRGRLALNRFKQFFTTPHQWMGAFFLIVFGYLILIPVSQIVLSTLRIQEGDTRRAGGEVGEWTLYYWQRTLSGDLAQRIFYEPLANTLIVSAGYTALAMTIGVVLAWLLVKTDLPFKRFIGVSALIPYIVPSWTIALAWITMFGNDRVGIGAPGVLQSTLGITPPDWLAYGAVPIIVVLAINYFAFTFLLTASALATIDGRLEESAAMHGASGGHILRRITLPLILPALGSAFILTFAQGIGTFGAPAFLGIPVRFYVLSTQLYQSAGLGRFADAFALTLVLIVMAALAISMNSMLLGRRKQFTTMTGKGSTHRTVRLGRWRWPVGAAVLLFVSAAAFVPIGLLVWQSLQMNLGNFAVQNLTFAYWTGRVDGIDGILIDPRVQRAAWNSLRIGLAVAVSTALIGVMTGYVVSKARGTWLARVVEQMSFLPYVIPGIAFGAIYLTMFARPVGPLPALYGTIWIIILAAVVNRLPFASRTGISAMMQVGRSLEEAAEVHGANLFTRLWRILLPLTRRGFLAGFILSFVSTVKDLSLVVLLVTPQTMVLTVLTFGYVELGRRQFADAIGVVIVVIVLGCTWLAQWLTKTNPLSGFGGSQS